jgi:hypothetical protein
MLMLQDTMLPSGRHPDYTSFAGRGGITPRDRTARDDAVP